MLSKYKSCNQLVSGILLTYLSAVKSSMMNMLSKNVADVTNTSTFLNKLVVIHVDSNYLT